MVLQGGQISSARGKEGGKISVPWVDPIDARVVENFADLDLPKVEGVKFADFSAELDEPLGAKNVREIALSMDMAKIGELKGTEVHGRTLREIIKTRAAAPLISALVIAYMVHGSDKKRKDYFINGEIIGTPEEAEKQGISRLAYVMRMSVNRNRPGIYVPLLERTLHQQFVLYPDIARVVGITTFAKKIGPVVGVKSEA